LVNLLFILQIALIILIFLTATYWFFDIIGSNLFSFAEPIASVVKNFVKLFYDRDIEVGGIFVDGSLLLFDIIALIAIFLITKFKYYIYKMQDFVIRNIYKCKKDIEEKFNKQLKIETDEIIRKLSRAAILIKFEATNLAIDRFWGGDAQAGVQDTETYLTNAFCKELDSIKMFKYKSGGRKVIVYVENFEKIDIALNLINKFVIENRAQMKKNKWTVDYYCSVTAYENSKNAELEILPKLEALLRTKQKNEIVCFGTFNLRYSQKSKPLYYGLRLRGSYEIDGGSDVYYLVKNNED
jgi:hypothetical protein